MTTDSDSECSYVSNWADFNVIRVIIIVIVTKIIVIKIAYISKKSNNSNSYSNNGNKIIFINIFTGKKIKIHDYDTMRN